MTTVPLKDNVSPYSTKLVASSSVFQEILALSELIIAATTFVIIGAFLSVLSIIKLLPPLDLSTASASATATGSDLKKVRLFFYPFYSPSDIL